MSAFDALLTDQVAKAILWRFGLGAEGVERVRQHTIALLADAAQRVPRDNPRILAKFAERGLPAPAWRLDNDDDAVEFTFALRRFNPTPEELHAAALLRACVAANDAGEVTPLVNEQIGARARVAHATSGAGNSKLTTAQRDEIARRYAERVRNGTKYGAIKELAADFKVSERTISEVIHPKTFRK